MLYIPNYSTYPCIYIRGQGVARAYRQRPNYNQTISYRDFYLDSHYTYVDGEQSFNQYSSLPTCLSSSELTDAYVYRHDFVDIMIVFVLMVGLVWFLISKLIKTFFRGFKRY